MREIVGQDVDLDLDRSSVGVNQGLGLLIGGVTSRLTEEDHQTDTDVKMIAMIEKIVMNGIVEGILVLDLMIEDEATKHLIANITTVLTTGERMIDLEAGALKRVGEEEKLQSEGVLKIVCMKERGQSLEILVSFFQLQICMLTIYDFRPKKKR